MKAARAAAAVAGTLILVGCAKAIPSGLIKAPPGGSPVVTSTTLADTTGKTLTPVDGHPTTTVRLGGGGASLAGTVNSPNGVVAGANVHAERLVGDTFAQADAITAADGSWSIPAVRGGRYRVRAWRAPDLDLVTPEIFFLGATESKVLALHLAPFTGVIATAAVNPGPIVEQPFTIAVVVSNAAVDTAGVARAVPATFVTVSLTTTGDLTIDSLNPSITDASGKAEWQVRCHTIGPQAVSVTFSDNSTLTLDVPPCGQVPASTTTAPGGPPTTRH